MKIKILDCQENLLMSLELQQVNSPTVIVLPPCSEVGQEDFQDEAIAKPDLSNYQIAQKTGQEIGKALETALSRFSTVHSAKKQTKER